MTSDANGDVVVPSNITHRGDRRRSRRVHQPLTFWRDGLGARRGGRYRMVVKALGRVALFNEPDWLPAAGGDAASAIAVAVHHLLLAREAPAESRIDIVMSALWRSAMDENPASITLFGLLHLRLEKNISLANRSGRKS